MRILFFSLISLMIALTVSPALAADSFSSPNKNSVNVPTLVQAVPEEFPVMTPQAMVEILVGAAEESKVLPNRVMMKYRGIELTCIYDPTHDRMRIITPIAARGNITAEQFERAMEANFHTALDARYALNQGILFAAYIHPLSPLTRGQVKNALDQTATLAATFGKEYTSGFLTYRGRGNPL